jgi:hypothetical protein
MRLLGGLCSGGGSASAASTRVLDLTDHHAFRGGGLVGRHGRSLPGSSRRGYSVIGDRAPDDEGLAEARLEVTVAGVGLDA